MSFISGFFILFTGLLFSSCNNKGEINSIQIGNQIWMVKNLDVTHFRNGDSIPQVTDDAEWETTGSRGEPAWCYYLNDKSNGKMYGKLYNLNAVKDPRGLVPEGWSLPTEQQWQELSETWVTNGLQVKSLVP